MAKNSAAQASDSAAISALCGVIARIPKRPNIWVRASENSGSVGAVLAESALQAGLNYQQVVAPRVRRFVGKFPSASTVSGLRALLENQEAASLLGINNARKCRTFRELTELLHAEGVETAAQLKAWLQIPDSRTKLLALHGVGVKTAAYLKLLVGLQGIAIDVHLRRAAAEAGVITSDEELERLYTAAASRSEISLADLDGSLWERGAEASRRKRGSMRQ